MITLSSISFFCMSKVLYFVDSIHYHSEANEFSVKFLATVPQDDYVRIVTLSSDQMIIRGWKGRVREGWYVYYDEEHNEQPLTYGNRSKLAKEQFKRYKELLIALSRRYFTPGESKEDEIIKCLRTSTTAQVVSFHVNVGHGNCSLILILEGKEYWLWGVDCSIKDVTGSFSNNLEECLDEVALRIGIENRSGLHIDRFFLTHPHNDHYNGMEYLIDNGYIDKNTICYINWYYHMPYDDYLRIMEKLNSRGVRFVEPLIKNSNQGIGFLYPEFRIYRHKTTVDTSIDPDKKKYRIISNANNASSVILFELGNRSMLFPGDLEKGGFKKIVCRGVMNSMDYYVVSHHGSLNGHPDFDPSCKTPGVSFALCLRNRIDKAILMGRDGAYSDVYSEQVLSFFRAKSDCLVYTEKDSSDTKNKFIELDWGNGQVIYHN